jgi:hypothetical protein
MYQIEIVNLVMKYLPKNINTYSIKVGDFVYGTKGIVIDAFDVIYYLIGQGVRIVLNPEYMNQLNESLGNLGKFPTSTFKLAHRDVQYVHELFMFFNGVETVAETPVDDNEESGVSQGSIGGVPLQIINYGVSGEIGGIPMYVINACF